MEFVRNFWWVLHKDLVSEFRARRAWPTMLLLGIVVAVVFSLQADLPDAYRLRLVGGFMWLAVFFAGVTSFDRSFAAEEEDGCWEGLRLLPISCGALFLAKFAVNFAALSVLGSVLIPLFFLLSDLPLWSNAGPMAATALLANAGLAAVGTLVSAAATGSRSGNLLCMLVLPLSIPVILAAAECTRLAVAGPLGETWWRWTQLLAGFAVIFITAGTLLFEFAIED